MARVASYFIVAGDKYQELVWWCLQEEEVLNRTPMSMCVTSCKAAVCLK